MSYKIYTKTGDKGQTSLFGGKRLPKNDIRIEAYGTVDELNASIGLCIVQCKQENSVSILRDIQNRLFTIGSHLATDPKKKSPIPDIDQRDIHTLEDEIDRMDKELPSLTNFVLPGSGIANAHLHLARTICRRAERRVLSLHEEQHVGEQILIYLNRLSDYLFVLSRYEGWKEEEEEIFWRSRKEDSK